MRQVTTGDAFLNNVNHLMIERNKLIAKLDHFCQVATATNVSINIEGNSLNFEDLADDYQTLLYDSIYHGLDRAIRNKERDIYEMIHSHEQLTAKSRATHSKRGK